METFLGWIRGSAKLLGWFVSSVVIPITIWFTVLRNDVNSVAREQVAFKVQVERKFEAIDLEFQKRSSQNDTRQEKLNDTLGEIKTALGEVRGELKRISR